jgi:hypothetical protein
MKASRSLVSSLIVGADLVGHHLVGKERNLSVENYVKYSDDSSNDDERSLPSKRLRRPANLDPNLRMLGD